MTIVTSLTKTNLYLHNYCSISA